MDNRSSQVSALMHRAMNNPILKAWQSARLTRAQIRDLRAGKRISIDGRQFELQQVLAGVWGPGRYAVFGRDAGTQKWFPVAGPYKPGAEGEQLERLSQ